MAPGPTTAASHAFSETLFRRVAIPVATASRKLYCFVWSILQTVASIGTPSRPSVRISEQYRSCRRFGTVLRDCLSQLAWSGEVVLLPGRPVPLRRLQSETYSVPSALRRASSAIRSAGLGPPSPRGIQALPGNTRPAAAHWIWRGSRRQRSRRRTGRLQPSLAPSADLLRPLRSAFPSKRHDPGRWFRDRAFLFLSLGGFRCGVI